jgi:hypothetical protein
MDPRTDFITELKLLCEKHHVILESREVECGDDDSGYSHSGYNLGWEEYYFSSEAWMVRNSHGAVDSRDLSTEELKIMLDAEFELDGGPAKSD